MNPNKRRYPVERLQTHPDADHQSWKNAPRMTSDWDTYCQYSRYTDVETHSNNDEKCGEPSPPPQSCRDSEGVDPDHDPAVMHAIDTELARKRKELQEIEQQIIQKKAAIAIKTVGLCVQNSTTLGASSGEQPNLCKEETLRNRVKEILQQRPFSIFTQVHLRKERLKSSILRKRSLLQEHHPLKRKVKDLKQKRRDSCVSSARREKAPDVLLPPSTGAITSPNEGDNSCTGGFERFLSVLNKGAGASLVEMVSDAPLPPPSSSRTSPAKEGNNKSFKHSISLLHRGGDATIEDVEPDVPLPPPSQSVASPAEDDGDANKGFECFLGLLNKGVDGNLSDKIPLPPASPSVTSSEKEEKSIDKGFERFLAVLNKGVDINLLRRIVNDDGEDLPSFQPAAKSKSDPPLGRGSQWSDSRAERPGCSKSSAESKSQTLRREPSLPDAKQRTPKKRDCGQSESPRGVKKPKARKEEDDGPTTDEKQKQLQSILKSLGLKLEVEEMSKLTDRTQERLYGRKNDGRPRAESPGEGGHQKHSHRVYSRSSSSSSSSSFLSSTSRSCSRSPSPRRRSRSRDSGSGSRAGATAWRKSCSQAQTPASRDRTFPRSAAPPDQSSYQYSHYTDYNSSTYRGATNSNWPSYPQHGGGGESEATHRLIHLHPQNDQLEDVSSLMNPDLSASEGQSGSSSGQRCLKVVTTERSSEPYVIEVLQTEEQPPGRKCMSQSQRKRELLEIRRQCSFNGEKVDRRSFEVSSQVKASQHDEDRGAEHSGEKKPARLQPTDEEIKANLRKKLQAFNQKAKDSKQVYNVKAAQPENSLNFELS